MTGYLSRIASQSGLRFSSQGRALPAETKSLPIKPHLESLDREETGVVPPPSIESTSLALATSNPGALPETSVPENIGLKSDPKKSLAKSDPEQGLSSFGPETKASPVGGRTTPVTGAKDRTRKSQTLASDDSRQGTAASQSLQAEPAQSTSSEPPGPIDPQKRQSPDPGGTGSTDPELPKKKYFIKTAEVLEGRNTEATEVHAVLLHEIQAWAAGGAAPEAIEGPVSRDGPNEGVTVKSETIETKRAVRSTDPEARVIGIGKKRPSAPLPQEASRIEEHSFDLSIGTISVVIEGDEHPSHPAPPPGVENRQQGHDAGPGPSRLGRHYL